MTSATSRVDHEVAIIIIRDFGGEFLLTHRRADRAAFPNKWGCGAGGKLDTGEPPDHAATRELLEETGILGTPEHRFDMTYEDATTTSRMHVFDIEADPHDVGFDESEWQATKWVNAQELERLATQTDDLCPDTAAMVLRYLATR